MGSEEVEVNTEAFDDISVYSDIPQEKHLTITRRYSQNIIMQAKYTRYGISTDHIELSRSLLCLG